MTESNNPSLSSLQVLRRLWAVAWRYRAQTLFVLLLQIVLLTMMLSGLGFTGLAVDIVRHELDPNAPIPKWPLGLTALAAHGAATQLLITALAVATAAAIGACLNYGYSVAVGRLVHLDIVTALRLEIFAKLQRLSFRFFDKNSSGSIVNRLTVDVQMLRSFVDGVVIQGTVLVLALSVFLGYMLSTHTWLTAVSLGLTPLLFAATVLFSRWAQPAYREGRRLADGLIRGMAETIDGVQVVKDFGQEQAQVARFLDQNTRVRNQQFEIFKNVSRFGPTVSFLNQLSVIVLLGYGGVLVARSEITLGELVVFVGLIRQFATRATNMAEIINVLQQSFAGARRVFELLDAPAEVSNGPNPILPGRLLGSIAFDNVTFGYTPDRPALEGISIELRPGECLGILGGTGSGKSTLLSLVPRFYDPTSGRILIDEIDLRSYDIDALRRQIGMVFQESLLFHDTVANNIAYGNPGASLEQIQAAARLADADGFIRALADGYDTMLEEGASNLSGGQRQRIALARALLLAPPILILDDPTAAIDAGTESELLRSVGNAIHGRTTLLVSNRLSTLECADRVLVIDHGRPVQLGTPAELLQQPGPYRRAAELLGMSHVVSSIRGAS